MLQKFLAAFVAAALTTLSQAGDSPSPKLPLRKGVAIQDGGPVSEGQFVFQMLLGEMALQRGDQGLAASAYADLAKRTGDVRLIERAIEVATYARQADLGVDLGRLWVELEPESAKARQTFAGLLLMNNRIDELGPQISKLIAQDPSNVASNLMGLNRLLARSPDKIAALRVVEQVVQPYGDLPEAHFALSLAATNAGDTPYALREAQTAGRLRADWELAVLLEAQALAKVAPVDAIRRLETFVGRNPNAREARLQLARLLIGEKRYGESRQQFERLLKDAPDAPEVVHPVAMLALQQGDTATARRLLEHLLTLDIPEKGGVHYFLGQMAEEAKDIDGAIQHYREVLSGDQYLPARARIANLLVQRGDLPEARRTLATTSTRTTADRVQLILAEAQLLRDARQVQAAYDLVKEAQGKYTDNLDLLYDGALLAERVGKFDDMEAMLRRLIALNPRHAHGLNALGYSFAERNIRLAEAYELINRALALAPDDPFIMDSLGWVLFRQGRLDAALGVLEKAYGMRADPEIAAHLGEVLWQQNRREEATRLWQENAARNPENEALKATLERLMR